MPLSPAFWKNSGILEVRVLVMLHKGNKSLHAVFVPKPLEISLEIPLPPPVCLIRLLAGGKGQDILFVL